jgi:hypothetical protein
MSSHDFPTQKIGADLPNITNSVVFMQAKKVIKIIFI